MITNKNIIAALLLSALTAYAEEVPNVSMPPSDEIVEQTKAPYLEELDILDEDIADQVKAIEDLVLEIEQALESDEEGATPSKSQGFLAAQPENKKQLLAKIRTLRTQAKNLEQEYSRQVADIMRQLEEQKSEIQEETKALITELEAQATLEAEMLKVELHKNLKTIQGQINALLH